ncbi:MAG TPA: MDR family MFS transporter [Mycobacteriales bacterium]|jgi:EmrB/QacA subfamily drug resistance transporter
MTTPATRSAPSEQTDGGFTHRQTVMILVGLMMGMFLAALDQTVVSTAIRTIADDLNGFSLQAWATTAFLITSTIATPLYGKLSDIYGRKPFFLFAISIFIAGSALCGLSRSMYELAAFRAIQGIGAGGLFSMALAIIGDVVPPRQRARYQGYFLAVFGTSSVLGPVLGGLFAGANTILGVSGWRWIFYINVPIGLAALVVVNRVLQLPHTRRDHRIDWQGAVALVIGLVPLLIVAEQGREWGWSSTRSVACYVIGVIGLVLFYLAERMCKDDALIPLRLFRNRTFSVATTSSVIIGMGMFGAILVLPLYLQIVKGYSPTGAGLATLPLVLGIMAGSVISGQTISRTGRYKIFPIIGTGLMVVGLFLFSLVGADTPLWKTALIMPIVGLGLGGNMQPIILAIQNAVSPREIGVATSSVTFFRQMGGTLGTAVFLSVLLSTLPGKIAHAFDTVRGTPEFQAALAAHPEQAATLQAAGAGNTNLNDTSFISRLAPVIAHPFKVGFSDSMSVVFLMGAVIMVIGFVVVLMLPEIPLADRSASQARAAEAQAEAGAAAEAAPVPGAAFAEAIAERTEVAVDERNGLDTPDPDADGRGRHNADGHDGEVRIAVDGHAGEGRHEANGHDGEVRSAEADGRRRTVEGGATETDPTAEPVHGRPSAGT